MLQLQQLEQLIAFADQGTLSKAAEVLLISQPSLTRNMQSLEDDLGVQLFQRSKNKLILTETGKYTVQQARNGNLATHSRQSDKDKVHCSKRLGRL
ncbi:LysR family transcriptional regulator [Streptococcus parasuis]|uniref:LysR family transcriptional regulator n=1 Tax=Streptococcus parasuis TaxID=1501662 RepID=UPI003AB0A813